MPSFLKSLTPLALSAAALVIAPAASAETPRPISVQIQYDTSALTSHDGAVDVLNSLEEQAVRACRYDVPVSGAPRVDEDCANHAVAKAVAKIDHPVLTSAYRDTIHTGVRLLASQE
ncbi:MAG: UrcA family protein [Alphaproteobacteria bacterium]|nr:UrcA family protein [Alphaproteobacteria bacterium]|tara:strand:+ start:922 stop:1272 length:351 start_codon:yes stop_codon:yes gene_type:complete